MHVREQLLLPRPNGYNNTAFDTENNPCSSSSQALNAHGRGYNERTFGTCTVGSDSYIVYVSGNKLLICSGKFELLQRLEPFSASDEPCKFITTLAVHPENAWVAVACDNSVVCFSPSSTQAVPSSSYESNPYLNGQLAQSTDTHPECEYPTQSSRHSCVENSGYAVWSQIALISHPEPVTSLSWSSHGKLLVGGKSVVFWSTGRDRFQTEFEIIEKLELANPIATAQFSPKGNMFSTLSSKDCLPKVWYHRPEKSTPTQDPLQLLASSYRQILDFTYLCHCSPVRSMEWRWPATSVGIKTFDLNTILTIAEDGVCRIWSQLPTTITGFISFSMTLAIDPLELRIPTSVPSPVKNSYVSTDECGNPLTNGTTNPLEPSPDNQICAIHWLTGSGLATTNRLRDQLELRYLMRSTQKPADVVQSRSKRLADTLIEYPDMLFCVLRSGAVIIWGIQNLSSKPMRTPKLIVVMKTEQTISPEDYDLFQGPLQIFCDQQSLCKSAIYFPAELSMLVQRRSDSVLACFTMNLDDFFTNAWTAPRFHLVYTWSGHRYPIESFLRHQCLPFIITTDSSGLAAVHKTSQPKRGLCTMSSMHHMSFLNTIQWSKSRAMCWISHAPILLISLTTEVIFIHMDESRCNRIGKLEFLDSPIPEFILFHALYLPPVDFSSSDSHWPRIDDGPCIIHILGVSNTGTVYMWAVSFKGATIISSWLISQSSLPVQEPIHSASVENERVYLQSPFNSFGPYIFQTISLNGCVSRWYCDPHILESLSSKDTPTRNDILWVEVAQFDLGRSIDLRLVASDLSGKLAAVNQSTAHASELVIWSIEAFGVDMIPEWSEKFNERITCMDWYISSDGQCLLAVGLQSNVAIYVQKRQVSSTDSPQWIQVSRIEVESGIPNDEILTVAWLHHGSVLVSTKAYTATYSKWIDVGTDCIDAPPINIFTATSELNGRFPDHHPLLLIQYLLWGQYDNVKYILSMLLGFARLCVKAGRDIPDIPIPLWKFFCDEKDMAVQGAHSSGGNLDAKSTFDTLFTDIADGSTMEDTLVNRPISTEFTHQDAEDLKSIIRDCPMQKLDAKEQMLLLSVIDSFSQNDQFDHQLDQNGVRYVLFLKLWSSSVALAPKADVVPVVSPVTPSGLPLLQPRGSLTGRDPIIESPRLANRDITWAFMSDCQDSLIKIATQLGGGKLLWADARDIGLGIWIRDPAILKQQFEAIARNQFLGRDDSRDPVACSLFYLALKKKTVLLGLWRLSNSHPEQASMLKFLANNFEEDRWRNAALKNAFALLGKQRYEYAAAFFLLAGKLKDAVSVCLKHLNDIQLAITIVRIYEGEEGPVFIDLLSTTLLPDAIANGDRWLVFMMFYMLKRLDLAFYAIVMPLEPLYLSFMAKSSVEAEHALARSSTSSVVTKDSTLASAAGSKPTIEYLKVADPALLILYRHMQERLKTTFMAIRPSISSDLEESLIYQSAQAYERFSCPALALHVIQSARLVDMPPVNIIDESSSVPVFADLSKDLASNKGSNSLFDADPVVPISAPAVASEFDLFESLNRPATTVTGGIDWSEMEPVHSSLDDELERELAALNKQLGSDISVHDKEMTSMSVPGLPSEVNTTTLQLTHKDWLRLVVHKQSIKAYTWILVMHICQSIYSSATTVSDYKAELKDEPVLCEYFSYLRQGITALRHIVDMPVSVMDRLLNLRCREMNALVAYMEIAPLHGEITDFNSDVSTFMVQEANTLARIAFDEFPTDISQKFLLLNRISIRLLRSFEIWNDKAGEHVLSDIVITQTSVTSFITLAMTSLYFKKYNRVWWIVGMCDQLFEVLLKGTDRHGLYYLIQDLLANREPIAHPTDDTDDQEGDEEDLFDEFGLPMYRAGTPEVVLAESLMHLLVLRHAGLALEHYLERVKEVINVRPGMDEAHGFLADSVMKGLNRYIFDQQRTLAVAWVHTEFKPATLMKNYLRETPLNPLWDLFRHTFDVKQMILDIVSPLQPIGDTVAEAITGQTIDPLASGSSIAQKSSGFVNDTGTPMSGMGTNWIERFN
ncbi:hypothetical protein BASA61_010537 [Batrachochytrium salamandrivorans]|nr:hypothetical protein BASA61_010537 [Batrachochytrium salamandrivorans]